MINFILKAMYKYFFAFKRIKQVTKLENCVLNEGHLDLTQI